MNSTGTYRLAFRLAAFTALATYALIVLGGVVFNTGSSLACPGWPLCNGILFPVEKGGVLYENSHRLLGETVGLCALALCGLFFKPAPGFRPLFGRGLALVLLIIIQGLLGAVIVLYELPPLIRTAHLATSLLVLMFILHLCRASALRARDSELAPLAPLPGAGAVSAILLLTLAAVYFQMVFGALIRHTNATYALELGWPGSLAPFDPATHEATLWPAAPPAQANALHRYLAPLIALLVTAASARAWLAARAGGRRALAWLAWAPLALVLAQILVGVVMIGTQLNVVARTAHLGVAALLLASLFVLYLAFADGAPVPAAAARPSPLPGPSRAMTPDRL